MEGVLAITFIFGGGTLLLLSVSPIGRALADRIRARTAERIHVTDPAVLEELGRHREEMTELYERLDFAERLLAREKAPDRVGSGGEIHP